MLSKIVEETLKDIIANGWTIETGWASETKFCLNAYPPFSSAEKTEKNVHLHKSNVYVNVEDADKFTESELAYAATYYLLGVLTGKGKLNITERRRRA